MKFFRRLPWPRTLKLKAQVAMCMVVLLAIGNVATLQFLLGKSDNLAATLNVAGKMRMLSQRIGVEALASHELSQVQQAQFQESYRAFDSAHNALLHGGRAFGLQVLPLEGHLRPLLQALYASWVDYRQTLDALIHAPHPGNAQVTQLVMASAQVLEHAEVLMDQLVIFANQAHQRALWSSMALFVIDVLLLGVGYVLISRRVLYPVHQLTLQCREMARGNYGMRVQLSSSDELAELASALGQSAVQIEQLLRDVAQERMSLAQMQAMFNGLAENEVAGIYMLDAQAHIVYANEQLARMFGYTPAALADHFSLERMFPASAYEGVRASVRERLEGRVHSARYERTALRADGSTFEIEIFGTAMQFQGQPGIIGMMMDITERKRAEASARRAALVYQHTSEGMVVTDADGVVQDINPAFTAMTGYEAHEVLGQRLNVLNSGHQDEAFYEAMWNSLLNTGSWTGDIQNRRKNGEEFVEKLSISTSYNEDGSVNCRIGLFSDVTQLRQKEASIWHQAHYDHLTQLPNRQMFQQNLLRCMQQSRHNSLPFALVFLDLDFFKEVNDTFGHDEGDELLRQVARRLQGCVRSTDLVARLGGDEFTLLLQDLKQLEDVHPVCRKVLQAVAQPYELGSTTVHISVSMGVTYYPRDGLDGVTLLKHADLAMYAAKEKGRNQFCEFAPSMEQEAQNRRLLLRDLQQGLDEQQFALHYQPIVEMQTQRIVKAEALIRWSHPVRGIVSPADFIPLAEESGLIVPLGDWVFREAARQVALWRSLAGSADFELSLNVSPVQLHSTEQSAHDWVRVLQDLQLPGNALVTEITERVLLEANKETNAKLLTLQKAGLQLALDDFGTGYSSLSYLKRFDIDYIKIDRSFVCHLTRESEDTVLCQAIIVMAHQLGIKVVAEGVETQEQHNILREAGCDYGQGYWYCRPVTAADFCVRLQAQGVLT